MTNLHNIGWVRFHRKSIDSSAWKNPVTWMVWSWCLLKASHKTSHFPFNGSDLMLSPGQFITGRNKAVKELPLSPQKWRTAMTYLKSTNRLTIKTTNKFSLITIINWELYQNDNQQSNQPLTNQQPASNQPVTTYNNGNNDKNDKKIDIAASDESATEKFDFSLKCKTMFASKDKRMPIIAYYWSIKGFTYEDVKTYEAALRRELRPAGNLVGYSNEKIKQTCQWLKENVDFKWTIETVHKYIDETLAKMGKDGKTLTDDDFIKQLKAHYGQP